MIDIKLTRNFRLSEFVQSDTADKIPALKVKQELLTKDILNNIIYVANQLQLIRDNLGLPIFINSGYRCPELNRKVKGVSNSAHLLGFAVDITTSSINGNDALFKSCKVVNFDQLIYYDNFIHLAFTNKVCPRKEVIERRTSVLR